MPNATEGQEAREWAEVRAAAISAVRAAIPHWPDSDCEEIADAVLAVCDEEAVNRMAGQFVAETGIRAMDFRNGASMDLEPSKTLVAHWVAAARTWLDSYGAVNYTETEVTVADTMDKVSMEVKLAGEFERFAFILQRVGPGKLTPHEARKRAEAEYERLMAENAALRDRLGATS